jgi:arylsulfatase A-like enzyme
MISMTRPTQAIALLAISALTILFLCADSISAANTDRPNILLIYADDIGYEALNCYGGLDFKTPRLNAMAKDGLRFSRAYTSPVCTPSRVSLHTSLYTTRHRHTGVLPVHKGTKQKVDFQKMPTFAQLMRDNGYLTSVTGKWQLATLEVWPDQIRNAGFDSWCIWQIWRQGKKTPRHWNATYNEDGKVRNDIADRFGPDVLADYVIEQMTEAKAAGKPFLIVHNELLPHWPIVDTPDDRAFPGERKPNLCSSSGVCLMPSRSLAFATTHTSCSWVTTVRTNRISGTQKQASQAKAKARVIRALAT